MRVFRPFVIAALALLPPFLPLSLMAQAPAGADIHGTWTVELRDGTAFLQLRAPAPSDWNGDRWNGDWSMGQTLPIDALTGLPANDSQLTAGGVKFELRREAGTLHFDGSFRDGRGAGLFTFAPRAEFAAEMKRLGYTDDLPVWRRYQLAVHDVGPKYINGLQSEGYDKLTLDQIQRAKTHGVTIDYIREIKALGFRPDTLEMLVRTRDHGVTQAYVQEMKAAGYTSATVEDLVRARDHGVRAAFVRDLAASGYSNVPLEEVIRARDHGVTADYVNDMKGLGLKDLTLAQIVRMRDHGITPGFVNHARARGFTTTDPDELVRLKNTGLWRERG